MVELVDTLDLGSSGESRESSSLSIRNIWPYSSAVEQATHNRLVPSSNLGGATKNN